MVFCYGSQRQQCTKCYNIIVLLKCFVSQEKSFSVPPVNQGYTMLRAAGFPRLGDGLSGPTHSHLARASSPLLSPSLQFSHDVGPNHLLNIYFHFYDTSAIWSVTFIPVLFTGP
jgi:hypothetical protein